MLRENEIPVGKTKDLRGQKFGKWTPLERDKIKNKWCKENNIPLIAFLILN